MFTLDNPLFTAPDRRYRTLEMSVELFFQLKFNPLAGAAADFPSLKALTVTGLPDDAEIQALVYDEFRGTVRLRVWSASFAELREGEDYPPLGCQIQAEEWRKLPGPEALREEDYRKLREEIITRVYQIIRYEALPWAVRQKKFTAEEAARFNELLSDWSHRREEDKPFVGLAAAYRSFRELELIDAARTPERRWDPQTCTHQWAFLDKTALTEPDRQQCSYCRTVRLLQGNEGVLIVPRSEVERLHKEYPREEDWLAAVGFPGGAVTAVLPHHKFTTNQIVYKIRHHSVPAVPYGHHLPTLEYRPPPAPPSCTHDWLDATSVTDAGAGKVRRVCARCDLTEEKARPQQEMSLPAILVQEEPPDEEVARMEQKFLARYYGLADPAPSPAKEPCEGVKVPEPPPDCECGGDKAGTPHSHWCPAHPKEQTNG